MILADKIITLRKRNGWSQEELAELIGVSRQSISKYEGAQAVPDMDKLLKLSRVFGVSTDLLIKDDMELDDAPIPVDDMTDDPSPVRKVSLAEASDYLSAVLTAGKKIALGVALCILSPVCIILLAGASEVPAYGISESFATGIGVTVLFLMVAAAVAMFIFYGSKLEKFEYIEKESIDTEYGVSGMVKERREREHDSYLLRLILGIMLCLCSVIPIFIAMTITQNEFVMECMVCVLLCMIALGVYFIISAAYPKSAMDALLEDGDSTREKKRENRRTAPFSGAYWMIATSAFLAYSFITDGWERSWILWPVAGVLYPAFIAIVGALTAKKGE